MTGEQEAAVANICQSWGKKYYSHADDLHACALLACLQAESKNPQHPNPMAQMISAALGGIKNYLKKERRHTAYIDLAKFDLIRRPDTFPVESCLEDYDFTELEMFIIEHRLAGYTDAEIAMLLGKNRRTVINLRNKIREKILDRH